MPNNIRYKTIKAINNIASNLIDENNKEEALAIIDPTYPQVCKKYNNTFVENNEQSLLDRKSENYQGARTAWTCR